MVGFGVLLTCPSQTAPDKAILFILRIKLRTSNRSPHFTANNYMEASIYITFETFLGSLYILKLMQKQVVIMGFEFWLAC